MMNLRLLPLVAACAAAGLAQAAPSQEDLARVRLYGNVTIAQDSVNSWGVWEQFEPPAAGPTTPSVSLPSTSELYRPLATVNVPATVTGQLCASGALCGFGLATQMGKVFIERPQPSEVSDEGERSGPRQGVFVVQPTVLAAREVPALSRGAWLPASMVFAPTALDGAPLGLLPTSSELTLQLTEFMETRYGYGDGFLDVYAGGFDEGEDLAGGNNVALAPMMGYVNGDRSGGGASVFGVLGVTSTVGDMAALQRGNAVVDYVGSTFNTGSSVALTVDFGQGRVVGGSFNGGSDGGGVMTYVASDGQRYVANGQRYIEGGSGVGINVLGGTVVGSNFVINQMSANDGTVSGRIQGAFFGPQAEMAAGAVDVVKSRTDGSYTNAIYRDVFFTVDQTKVVQQEAIRQDK